MHRMTDSELIRFEAEELGLTLSDNDVRIIKEKWRMSPTATIRLLLIGFRNLQDNSGHKRDLIPNHSAITYPVIWNCWTNNMFREGDMGAFIIHAFEESSAGHANDRTLCGVRWAETGMLKLGEFQPGCRKCRRIATKRGLLS